MAAQALHAVQRLFRILLPAAQRLPGLAQLIVEVIDAWGDRRIARIRMGIHAAAYHVRAPLHPALEAGLLHLAKGVTELRGCRALSGDEGACGVLHFFF